MSAKIILKSILSRIPLYLLTLILLLTGCSGADADTLAGRAPAAEKYASAQNADSKAGMEVHFLDVGQADCTLIKLEDAAMLIDGGNHDDEQMILSYLEAEGIQKLDYVIGTHPHEDHIGSLDAVIDRFEVGEVILPDQVHTSRTFESLLEAVDSKKLSVSLPEVGKQYELGDAAFTILSPAMDYGTNLNNWSVVIRLTYGKDSFLFSGDAEEKAEEDMIGTGLELASDVFKVSHHGSDTSNSKAYLDAITPQYAVISCGKGNSYGHPTQTVLEELHARRVKTYRTDEQGTVVAVSSGSGITWNIKPSTSMRAGKREGSSTSDNEQQAGPLSDSYSAEHVSEEDTAVHITKTGEKYHRADCQSLRNSDMEVTLREAKELGLDPCGKCMPSQ